MSLPLHLLESLIVLSENRSLAEASKKLYISQPALSMQLKKLEEQFELPIFEFQGKKKVLTLYGHSIYKEAKRLLTEFDLSFEQIHRQYLEGEKLSLRVGGRRELLLKAHKYIDFDGKVTFVAMSSETAIKSLESKQIDLAISRVKPNSANLIAKEFFTNSPWLVCHKKWVKGRSPSQLIYDLDFFMKTPAIIYTEAGDLLIEWLPQLNLSLPQLKIKYVCEDWLSILQMIEAGEGYSVIPDSIESNLEDVIHVKLPRRFMQAQTYFFIYNKSLAKLPHYKKILRT